MLTTKKPVVNGTLADFTPDGAPTSWNGEVGNVYTPCQYKLST